MSKWFKSCARPDGRREQLLDLCPLAVSPQHAMSVLSRVPVSDRVPEAFLLVLHPRRPWPHAALQAAGVLRDHVRCGGPYSCFAGLFIFKRWCCWIASAIHIPWWHLLFCYFFLCTGIRLFSKDTFLYRESTAYRHSRSVRWCTSIRFLFCNENLSEIACLPFLSSHAGALSAPFIRRMQSSSFRMKNPFWSGKKKLC